MKKLDIAAIFRADAEEMLKARADAIRIHGTSDIRAAGNEVEQSVRDYFHRMLPSRYYVAHGHLIDRCSATSPQLDIIVSDNTSLPSLMKTRDDTEYIPIDAVYSVGEIKSSYDKSKAPLEALSAVIKDIRENLHHPEVLNSAFGGLQDNTTIRDMALESGVRVLNRIFFFALFVNGDTFSLDDIRDLYAGTDVKYLPNVVAILNKGLIVWGHLGEDKFLFNRYPEESKSNQEEWLFMPMPRVADGSLEGNHLAALYYMLVEHLANSHLEPPSLRGYLGQLMIGRKSLAKKVVGD